MCGKPAAGLRTTTMQTGGRNKTEVMGRKAKLAHSYQELLDEFSQKDLKSVGNYTLGRLIGKGSFGKVYLASHKLTNGSKVVLKSANKDDSNLAREIHHHRQFVHPHIARLYEVIVTESMVWLVLEYCQGDELYNYLLKHGKLPFDKVQRIFTQLVGAVSYVHLQSCVHRDLKLENILLDKHENVKLVDFGFTREYEGKSNYLQTFCGTICYSAPEMLKGERYAGEKVDVWSLGVILYALLCGELPFDDDEDDVTRRMILADEPKYPDHLPPDGLALIKAMLSKRPLLRPTLHDILTHPFLAEHAPHQLAILELTQLPPFSTAVERDSLQRMRSAGVDIDSVIESVLAQRCDALAGWWTLLIEKEQRKIMRRERKRREKEERVERLNIRRLSTTSSRLERLATVEEAAGYGDDHLKLSDPPTPKSRGRPTQRRSGVYDGPRLDDFPGLVELQRINNAHARANSNASLAHGGFSSNRNSRNSHKSLTSRNGRDSGSRPAPVDRDSMRSANSSCQRRPIPPPKEGVLRSARSRGSTLHLVMTSDALAAAGLTNGAANARGRDGFSQRTKGAASGGEHNTSTSPHQKVRKKTSQAIITHWKNMTHWIAESTRRTKAAGKRGRDNHSTPSQVPKSISINTSKDSKASSPRPQTSKYQASSFGGGPDGINYGEFGIGAGDAMSKTVSLPKGIVANGFASKVSMSGGGTQGESSSIAQAGAGSSGVGNPNTPWDSSAGRGVDGGTEGIGHITGNGSTANRSLSPNSYAMLPANGSYQYHVASGTSSQQVQQLAVAPGVQTTFSYKRQSLSPSPLTPRSSVRRASSGHHSRGGLRGRKSTSSSVSSIRSIHQHHHHHSHSKASSTSSNGSVSTTTGGNSNFGGGGSSVIGSSPHHSVKVLPATPISASLPSSLRLVRGPVFTTGASSTSEANAFIEGMSSGRPPDSPNPFGSRYRPGGSIHEGSGGIHGGHGFGGTPVMFAKRKRNLFKGPMLNFGGNSSGGGAGGGRKHAHSRSASASGLGRRSGEITIEEEEEEEEVEAGEGDEEGEEEEEEEEEEGEGELDLEEMDDDMDVNSNAAISRFLLDGENADDVEEVHRFSPGEHVEEIYKVGIHDGGDGVTEEKTAEEDAPAKVGEQVSTAT
ncbi:hypothetical protein SEPCBS57363_003384 [Sporothrix epigloea]|uniref:Protein kinase domain-containing protein n=1 Tax=Sporothrix epigloea TaxID=1892477 RepID=A0ABP0DL53_9PEZI